MKLWAMPCRANQDRQVMVEMTRHFQWTKCGPLEKGLAEHFSIPALSTPWIVWKGKKIALKDELPRSIGAHHATWDQWRNNSRNNEETEPKQKQNPVVDVTDDGSKVNAIKSNYI